METISDFNLEVRVRKKAIPTINSSVIQIHLMTMTVALSTSKLRVKEPTFLMKLVFRMNRYE